MQASESDVLLENEERIRRLVACVLQGSTLNHLESFDDLMQVGRMGCLEAWRKYNPDLGKTFWNYANQRVYGAVVDHLGTCGLVKRKHRRAGRELPVVFAKLADEKGQMGQYEPSYTVALGEESDFDEFLGLALLRSLSRTEREILADYFVAGRLMKEIGAARGVSESRISNIVQRVLRQLREEANGEPASVS
jgi:RNA polymerase sigma factor for flagellar operon FliA